MQQEPQTQHQLTALAVVIESSLAIAQEWPNPLFQYCMHLFKRINEGHHPAKLRGAFVGYGTVDTVPSPILCKRFFTENTMVFREIFEEPMHFGIGMTNSGGTRGMAALEGLVAALEMFDDLHKLPNTKICGSFILHIAASAPDSSLRPEWNDSELMDDMTWDSFPAEFKKRNIGYNLLTLKPPKGRLAELYDATNTNADASPPWFDLRPLYTLSAASIASLQPVKAINKRQNEVPPATEQLPENKRPRLQPTAHESPKPIPKLPAQPPSDPDPPPPVQPSEPDISPQSQSQSQAQAQLQPQSQTQAQMQPAAPITQPAAHPPSQIPNVPMQQLPIPPGNPTPEELLERFATATEVMRKYEMGIQAAVAAGDMARAEARRTEYEKRKPQYERLSLMVRYYRHMSAMKQSSAQPTNEVPLGSGDIMPTGNTNSSMQPMTNSQTNSQMTDTHPSTTSSVDTAIPNNPNLNIQMQKFMEQNQPPLQPGSNVPVSGVRMPSPNPSVLPFATGGESVGIAGMPTEPRPSRPTVEWTGTLKWSGQGPNGTREMHCVVTVASALAPEKAHTEMWPDTMELIPVDKIPMIQLQEWIKKQQTCLCSFKAFTTESDQASYAVLMQLFDSVFAVASWTIPSGIHPTRNAIFFPYHQRTTSFIAGAIFPLTGIPDTLPKAIPQQMGVVPLPGPSLPPNMSQAMIQALKAMSPAERQQIMAQWFMRHNIMRQQQQQRQASELATQGSGIPSFNPNTQLSANQAPGSNMMTGGAPPQGNFMMNQNPQSHGGLPANMLSGSVGGMMPMIPGGGNTSYEALHSLMQRNAGNGMNMNLEQNMGL